MMILYLSLYHLKMKMQMHTHIMIQKWKTPDFLWKTMKTMMRFWRIWMILTPMICSALIFQWTMMISNTTHIGIAKPIQKHI